ncbi:hypothetical protein M752DRAFT_97706 [Aspergillus phoenicis ATCC 13157]|uniref:Uncharacterized protein n=1 Tax=Aspergillus phoenicis ATCC 13157 TaxID=1353007 RepID=A0A370PVB6_ASPPH|nr:hypothetical protein M752DRAFT_97706 [Aspergillus phoenicis ATCC 13157]
MFYKLSYRPTLLMDITLHPKKTRTRFGPTSGPALPHPQPRFFHSCQPPKYIPTILASYLISSMRRTYYYQPRRGYPYAGSRSVACQAPFGFLSPHCQAQHHAASLFATSLFLSCHGNFMSVHEAGTIRPVGICQRQRLHPLRVTFSKPSCQV